MGLAYSHEKQKRGSMRSRCSQLVSALACSGSAASAAVASAQKPNPEREPYLGETHVHTWWSFDFAGSSP